MKNLKLLAVLIVGMFVANATFALENTGATAFSSSVGGSGAGIGLLSVVGTNGTYSINTSSGDTGSVTPVTAVQNVNTITCVAVGAYYTAVHSASVYVIIPSGCTGSVSYNISKDQYGTAYVTIGSTNYSSSGSTTLAPGMYYLNAYAAMLSTSSTVGSQAIIGVTITLD